MVLPFSRMTFVWPVLICDQSAWVAAHVAAFSFLGAAPRQIRVDNLKTGVLRPCVAFDSQSAAMTPGASRTTPATGCDLPRSDGHDSGSWF